MFKDSAKQINCQEFYVLISSSIPNRSEKLQVPDVKLVKFTKI